MKKINLGCYEKKGYRNKWSVLKTCGAGWGATSDQIVLEPGDVISLAGFTSWDFYQDSGYGFHYFADSEGNMTHAYTAEAGTACNIKLIKDELAIVEAQMEKYLKEIGL